MKHLACAFATFWLMALIPVIAQACGVNSQCRLGDRHYYIATPDGDDGQTRIPALIFAHGYQGSALGIIRNPRLRKVTNELGIAFIAVKSQGQSWSTMNSPSGNEQSEAVELAYFDAVKKDVTPRFNIDPDKIVMSGASTGGMVTWTLACERSDAFAAFIPMSGTFWAPVPPACTGRVANIIHFHGDKDRTVPLNGRPIDGTHQGSVSEALAMYRSFGGFGPAHSVDLDGLRCENSANQSNNIVNFCLYSGGHSFQSKNVAVAWRMLQAAGQLNGEAPQQ